MRIVLTTLLIAVWMISGCQTDPGFKPSDDFNKDYQKILKIPASDQRTLKWLEINIDSLPVLFHYEFSRRLNVVGRREDAIRELMRARLARDMDLGECVRKDRNSNVPVMLDITNILESGLHGAGRQDTQMLNAAIANALAWEPTRTNRPSALWLCGNGNLKDSQAAAAGRKAAYDFLLADFSKIRSQSEGGGH